MPRRVSLATTLDAQLPAAPRTRLRKLPRRTTMHGWIAAACPRCGVVVAVCTRSKLKKPTGVHTGMHLSGPREARAPELAARLAVPLDVGLNSREGVNPRLLPENGQPLQLGDGPPRLRSQPPGPVNGRTAVSQCRLALDAAQHTVIAPPRGRAPAAVLPARMPDPPVAAPRPLSVVRPL